MSQNDFRKHCDLDSMVVGDCGMIDVAYLVRTHRYFSPHALSDVYGRFANVQLMMSYNPTARQTSVEKWCRLFTLKPDDPVSTAAFNNETNQMLAQWYSAPAAYLTSSEFETFKETVTTHCKSLSIPEDVINSRLKRVRLLDNIKSVSQPRDLIDLQEGETGPSDDVAMSDVTLAPYPSFEPTKEVDMKLQKSKEDELIQNFLCLDLTARGRVFKILSMIQE